MFLSTHRTFPASLALLLMTACGSKAVTESSTQEDHEALRGAIAEVKADTGVTKTNTELLKLGITSAQEGFTELGTQLDSSVTGLSADLTAVKNGAGALQTAATSLLADTAALRTGVTALQSQLSAARRYSKTCNPSTDTWLRSAWPGLSDAEVTEACRRDGRWHYLGTMADVIRAAIVLPDDMEVGLTSYSSQIMPATVNSWNDWNPRTRIRLCTPALAAGNTNTPSHATFVHQCISYVNSAFTVTHNPLYQADTVDFSYRDYTGYNGSNESSMPCSTPAGGDTCSLSQSLASHWKIYVRQ